MHKLLNEDHKFSVADVEEDLLLTWTACKPRHEGILHRRKWEAMVTIASDQLVALHSALPKGE